MGRQAQPDTTATSANPSVTEPEFVNPEARPESQIFTPEELELVNLESEVVPPDKRQAHALLRRRRIRNQAGLPDDTNPDGQELVRRCCGN